MTGSSHTQSSRLVIVILNRSFPFCTAVPPIGGYPLCVEPDSSAFTVSPPTGTLNPPRYLALFLCIPRVGSKRFEYILL